MIFDGVSRGVSTDLGGWGGARGAEVLGVVFFGDRQTDKETLHQKYIQQNHHHHHPACVERRWVEMKRKKRRWGTVVLDLVKSKLITVIKMIFSSKLISVIKMIFSFKLIIVIKMIFSSKMITVINMIFSSKMITVNEMIFSKGPPLTPLIYQNRTFSAWLPHISCGALVVASFTFLRQWLFAPYWPTVPGKYFHYNIMSTLEIFPMIVLRKYLHLWKYIYQENICSIFTLTASAELIKHFHHLYYTLKISSCGAPNICTLDVFSSALPRK